MALYVHICSVETDLRGWISRVSCLEGYLLDEQACQSGLMPDTSVARLAVGEAARHRVGL